MSNDEEQAGPLDQGREPIGRLIATDAQKGKARKFFEHAKKASDTRNYDYAIKLYVDGLALWPDAVEEGLKKLRVVATARRLDGGKSLGFIAAHKYPIGGKDVLKSLKNALYLFGMDPTSIPNMESILKLATKAKCDQMVQWIAPVLADAYNNTKKLPANRYSAICEAMDEAAVLTMALGEDESSKRILEAAVATSQIWGRHYPRSSEAEKALADATGKLTIVKGRYSHADGFTESLKNAEAQHDLHDQDRLVQSENRNRELITKARKDWEDNPSTPSKLLHLVDMMTRIERDETENEAIALLEQAHEAGGDYVFKQKADDLKMRQLNRHRRQIETKLKLEPENAELKQALARHLALQSKTEIEIFTNRVTQYPTDLKLRYILATRLFTAKRHDDAIPLFQQSQVDGRCRGESRLYLGRCFIEKRFFEQAVGTLRRAIEELDATGTPLALELNYWLARGLEASGEQAEAKKTYGHLIQLDYNYRDARHRLEKLVAPDAG